MQCKKCGQYLVSGQIICSNCDTDNSEEQTQQTSVDKNYNMQNENSIYNNQTNISSTQINQSSYAQNQYQNSNEINYNNLNTKSQEKENNSNGNKKGCIIAIILVFFLLLIPTIIGIIIVIAQNNINSKIKRTQKEHFVSEYKELKKQVRLNIVGEQLVSCNQEECIELYDYDYEKASFEIEDRGNHYKFTYEVNEDKYNIVFDKSTCDNMSDSICVGNKIIGKIYK